MRAAARAWTHAHPEVRLTVTLRALAAFNDAPVHEAARGVDLIVIDHPMMGVAAESGALEPLERTVPDHVLQGLAADSVGSSFQSYSWNGHQLAAAIDAACQVSVSDVAGLDALGVAAPRTWDDVLRLAAEIPGSVAVPLYPSDAIALLMTLSASMTGSVGDDGEVWSVHAIEILADLARFVDPRSFAWNPPALLDIMADPRSPGPVYCPVVFGYTDYQRPPAGRLRFGGLPTIGQLPARSLRGGAGLAVSASSRHQEASSEFVAWLADRTTQRHLVLPHGGQPASRATWDDPSADALVGGFFSRTRPTLEASFVRPRHAWWPRFQAIAGEELAAALRRDGSPAEISRTLAAALRAIRAR